MRNNDFAKELEKRTRLFTLNIFKLSSALPNTPEGMIIRRQIGRSGSSIGANYREANRARSKADFKNKIGICEGEANETLYWLEIIQEARMINSQEIVKLYYEAKELLAIFTTIGKNIKS